MFFLFLVEVKKAFTRLSLKYHPDLHSKVGSIYLIFFALRLLLLFKLFNFKKVLKVGTIFYKRIFGELYDRLSF